MRVIENHCRGCAAPGYPCVAPYCDFFCTVVYYCDVCGEECEGDVCEACGAALPRNEIRFAEEIRLR